MKKQIFKHILDKCLNVQNGIGEGYEMDCLISSEFTPAPDGSEIRQTAEELCKKYGYNYPQFLDWLIKMDNKWKHPFHSSLYGMLLSEEGMHVFSCLRCHQKSYQTGLCEECEQLGYWMDPMGGIHFSDDECFEDAARMYE